MLEYPSDIIFFFPFSIINFTVRKMIAQINAKSDWLISKKNNLKSIKLFVQIKGKLEFQASMKKIHARLNNTITERINTTLILYISFQSRFREVFTLGGTNLPPPSRGRGNGQLWRNNKRGKRGWNKKGRGTKGPRKRATEWSGRRGSEHTRKRANPARTRRQGTHTFPPRGDPSWGKVYTNLHSRVYISI